MFDEKNSLSELAKRAESGEPPAAQALHRALQPHLARIVKRSLRTPGGSSALGQRIHLEASRLEMIDRDHLIGQVAGRLNDALGRGLARLAPAGMMDTVVA